MSSSVPSPWSQSATHSLVWLTCDMRVSRVRFALVGGEKDWFRLVRKGERGLSGRTDPERVKGRGRGLAYLVLVGVGDGNAPGGAAHVAGLASLKAGDDRGLKGVLRGRGRARCRGSGAASRRLGVREEGEDAGKEDRSDAHVDGIMKY